ncbi:MAG: TRAP transporter fused permease subunit [Lachnospiraceae bacterium]|nr:TRAP transporter fused permease subunit [Lachnospiraceae bacterium]
MSTENNTVKDSTASKLDEKAKALANEPDEDSKIAKMIKAMPKWRYTLLVGMAFFWLAFQLYIKLVKPFDPWFQLPLHMCLALYFVVLMNPMADKYKKKIWWLYDGALIVAISVILYYFISHASKLNLRLYSVDPMSNFEVVVAVLLLFTVMEAVRRVVSMSLFVVIAFFMAYAWFGQYVPGLLHFQGISFSRFCETLMLGENGIFGSPLGTSLNTLFYFLLFGTFFANTGGGGVLIDAGMKLSDKTVGGPAKAAVISSGLMGMISGSAVANVSSTGVFTIPLMKRTGYSPEEAASVESVASTGGQIMPPIMGAGAFIMAEIIGIQYVNIAAAAIIPAIAYFASAFMLVHLIARKKHIGKDSGVKYEGKPILPRVYRLLPIVVLVVMIIKGYSLPRSAIYCTVLAIVVSMSSRDTRMSLKKLIQTLLDGCRQAANIAIPTAACGIMIGIVVRSGIAVKIAKMIDKTGNNSLFLALIIAAAGCLLLGMALPTVAAYLIANTLFISAIQGLGISALTANMFIFYFGVVAQITPPVCLASFTAAGIAGGSAWKTGWKAFSYASVAFIAPFMFVYRPALLLEGQISEIVIAGSMLFLATFCIAGCVSGYMFKTLNKIERALFLIAALFFILPSGFSDIAGLTAGAVLIAYTLVTGKKERAGVMA